MDNHKKVNNEADIQANIKANIHEDRPADSEKDIQAAGSEDFQEELVKLRRSQQDGNVGVMTAGMHQALRLGFPRTVRKFRHRKGINIRPNPDNLSC